VKEQVTIRIPATTSNLGPGFDCLGVALRIYNWIDARRDKPGSLSLMAAETADKFFTATQRRPFNFSSSISGAVPIARGLGSSVTVRLGMLHALNELAGTGLNRFDLFALCADLETHPDNAAPASFGGFTIARSREVQRFIVSRQLQFVLLVPEFEVETTKARRLLPKQIDRAEAVMSSGNAAAITAAFASRDYERLRGAFRDGLHQPFRKRLVPFLDKVITAAEEAGAFGAFLSGSGPAVCAVTLRNPRKVADAMRSAAGLGSGRMLITSADNHGVRILKTANQKSKNR
jgi:homoserine kinase